ncbi:hypothetical protein [Streptomyces acidicola]|uniref:hypothetical protein n=1 Tax=Streptomyces acidicola TaxID=2596892 RepID=UPI003828EE98
MRYAHAEVQVRFPDGVRDLDLRLLGHERLDHPDGGTKLALHFIDPHYPLALDTHYRLRAGTDEIERLLRHVGTAADGPVGGCADDLGSAPVHLVREES